LDGNGLGGGTHLVETSTVWGVEIRNPKLETNLKSQMAKARNGHREAVLDFEFSPLGFVSDFGFRVSDFKCLPGGVGRCSLLVCGPIFRHAGDHTRVFAFVCVQTNCNPELEPMNSPESCGKGPLIPKLPTKPTDGPVRPPVEGVSCPLKGLNGDGPVAPTVETAVLLAEHFTAPERTSMLELARTTLRTVVSGTGELPEVCAEAYGPRLTQKRACFVTLTKEGKLRGCVGQVLAREPLYQAIATTTRSAALSDPRFSPVTAEEEPQIHIEISVLTEPQALSFSSPEDLLNQLRPHEHGVIFKIGSRLSTFLPQVWEHLPDKTEFLNRLAEKAGFPPAAWRSKAATIRVYRVESFEET
jgi:uncharacterized protein